MQTPNFVANSLGNQDTEAKICEVTSMEKQSIGQTNH